MRKFDIKVLRDNNFDFIKQDKTALWKSWHRHLGISIGIDDVGIGIGIAKNLFCLAKSLFLPFKVLYEENIHDGVLFKYTC